MTARNERRVRSVPPAPWCGCLCRRCAEHRRRVAQSMSYWALPALQARRQGACSSSKLHRHFTAKKATLRPGVEIPRPGFRPFDKLRAGASTGSARTVEALGTNGGSAWPAEALGTNGGGAQHERWRRSARTVEALGTNRRGAHQNGTSATPERRRAPGPNGAVFSDRADAPFRPGCAAREARPTSSRGRRSSHRPVRAARAARVPGPPRSPTPMPPASAPSRLRPRPAPLA